MSYIQNNLQAGEEIKYRADIHWYIFVCPVVLILLGAFFSLVPSGLLYYTGLIFLLLGLLQLVKKTFLKLGAEYVVTNKKVVLKSGFFSRDALELSLNKCEGLRVTQSVLGRILGFGAVVVTTGGVTNTFEFIVDPVKFRNEINAQLL